jgi:hypothetical protein
MRDSITYFLWTSGLAALGGWLFLAPIHMFACISHAPKPPNIEFGLYFLFVYLSGGFCFGAIGGIGLILGGVLENRFFVRIIPMVLVAAAVAFFSYLMPQLPERLQEVNVGFRITPVRIIAGLVCGSILTPIIHSSGAMIRAMSQR